MHVDPSKLVSQSNVNQPKAKSKDSAQQNIAASGANIVDPSNRYKPINNPKIITNSPGAQDLGRRASFTEHAPPGGLQHADVPPSPMPPQRPAANRGMAAAWAPQIEGHPSAFAGPPAARAFSTELLAPSAHVDEPAPPLPPRPNKKSSAAVPRAHVNEPAPPLPPRPNQRAPADVPPPLPPRPTQRAPAAVPPPLQRAPTAGNLPAGQQAPVNAAPAQPAGPAAPLQRVSTGIDNPQPLMHALTTTVSVTSSYWDEALDKYNADSIETALNVLTNIANEKPENRENMAAEVLGKYLAYGNFHEYQKRQKKLGLEPKLTFPMMVGEKRVNYTLHKEVDLLGGYSAIVFTPDQKGAPPLVLFPGTMPFGGGRGSGITVIEDLNPAGPGAGIVSSGKSVLEDVLRVCTEKAACKATTYGHSLGGAVATRTGILIPQYISQTNGFNSPRQGVGMEGKYKALTNLHTAITAITTSTGLSSAGIVKILDHPNISRFRPVFTDSDKQQLRMQVKAQMLEEPGANPTEVKALTDAQIDNLITMARAIKKDHDYTTIPDSPPQLNTFLPVMKQKGHIVPTKDVITKGGHTYVGDVHHVEFEADAAIAKLGIHSAPMMMKNHKITKMDPKKMHDINESGKRKAGITIQIGATAFLAYPIGVGLLAAKRVVIGARSGSNPLTRSGLVGWVPKLISSIKPPPLQKAPI